MKGCVGSLLFAALLGCGQSTQKEGSDAPGTGGAQGGSAGSTSGTAGGGGMPAGSGGSSSGAGPDCSGLAGTTGLPAGPCPSAAPANASPCADAGRVCAYEDCRALGRYIARCEAGAWRVETAPCGDFVSCSNGFSCGAGVVCTFLPVGDEPYGTCSPSRCGTGPISCDCVQGCGRGCELVPALDGVSIECTVWPNDCP